MTADKKRFPVLLANGDPIASGDLRRRPALGRMARSVPQAVLPVRAGRGRPGRQSRDLHDACRAARSQLGIWVRAADLPKTEHALARAADSRWRGTSDVYGREYDLDVFNIVAVDDFNFGAMENKGLNIFNSRYILADPDTATDYDYDAIAAVVAHEYFHNWSGNRVTCRDWFQLSLKEGFTVFRDQGFSADQGSAAVKRIEDVRGAARGAIPRGCRPARAPDPARFAIMEISNFYTATIYNKGAEVIRMMATILGPERFRAATDLYFDRYDGTAATCEDFVALHGIRRRGRPDAVPPLVQPGRARRASRRRSTMTPGRAARRCASRSARRRRPGQPDKEPFVLPLKIKLFGGETGAALSDEQLVHARPADRARSCSTASPSARCCRSTAASRRR